MERKYYKKGLLDFQERYEMWTDKQDQTVGLIFIEQKMTDVVHTVFYYLAGTNEFADNYVRVNSEEKANQMERIYNCFTINRENYQTFLQNLKLPIKLKRTTQTGWTLWKN